MPAAPTQIERGVIDQATANPEVDAQGLADVVRHCAEQDSSDGHCINRARALNVMCDSPSSEQAARAAFRLLSSGAREYFQRVMSAQHREIHCQKGER